MIGIYDSGIGGLLVAAEIERHSPGLALVYANDTARAPLSGKSMATVAEATRRGLAFLVERGATLLVIAGNTAACMTSETSAADNTLQVVTPIAGAVDQALAATATGRIGLIAGPAVIASGCFERALREKLPTAEIIAVSCPLLPALVESGWSNKRETKMILRRYLHPFKEGQIDTLILGCGHCSLLRQLIQARVGKRVRVIDSSLALADRLLQLLAQQPTASDDNGPTPGDRRYFVSDRNPTINTLAARILARPVELLPW